MKTWAYVAYGDDGKRVKGVIVAATESAAAAELRNKGLLTQTLVAQKNRRGAADKSRRLRWRRRSMSADLRAVFMRQMAVLLEAGLTVAQTLETIAGSGAPPQIEQMAQEVRAALLAGDSFSGGLDQAEAGFPPYAICALAAGESSGQLAEVTETLASYFEDGQRERASIANAMIYPAFVAMVALLVALTLMRTVAPEIARLYATMGRDLPVITQVLMAGTDFLFENSAALSVGAIAAAVLAAAALRRPTPRRIWDAFRMRLPLTGRFIKMAAAAQYLRTLAVVIQSRQPVAIGVASAVNVLSIDSFRTAAEAAATGIERGQSLSQALTPLPFIPLVAGHLIGAGEQSGRLGRMVERSAMMVETDLNNARKQVIALLEPVLMVMIGVMVLVIVLAVLLPIFDLQADIMP